MAANIAHPKRTGVLIMVVVYELFLWSEMHSHTQNGLVPHTELKI